MLLSGLSWIVPGCFCKDHTPRQPGYPEDALDCGYTPPRAVLHIGVYFV